MRRSLSVIGLTLLLCAAIVGSPARAEFFLDDASNPAEVVETLTVRIDVGAAGEDLCEPIALDLGLGFPFWLHPVGRVAADEVPFGAVPQEATAGSSVPAGSSAVFAFHARREPGQDALRTSSQLLGDVQVSDIARIGFVAPGASNWVLAGYQIEINGRVFAYNDDVNQGPQELRAAAQLELADLGTAIAPLEAERAELEALAEAELALEADRERLAAVELDLSPLRTRQRWLEGQIDGRYPCFAEPSFRSPWREESSVDSARVILVTHSHPNADTRNYVYFRTGGRKYPLNFDGSLLSAAEPSQQFEIDLHCGPLTAADLRGYAVGMLAHGQPYATAPDRWHPQRILVELDGRVVYDSDESPIDHNSLEAIRVIPPAHVDAEGSPLANEPTARETFVWVAGQGQGLDLVEGGALPLPAEDDPIYPDPEPAMVDPADPEAFDETVPSIFGPEEEFPEGFDPFPGETADYYYPDDMWSDPYGMGGIWPDPYGMGGMWPDPYGMGGMWPDPFWPDPYWPDDPWSGGGWPGGLLDLVFSWLLDLSPLDPGEDPPPIGEPVQIESVRITEGWQTDDTFTVEWTVSGDESQVDYYQVALWGIDPTQVIPTAVLLASYEAPVGMTEWTTPLTGLVDPLPPFIAPAVVAMPTPESGEVPSPPEFGPAKPLFPAGTHMFSQFPLPDRYTSGMVQYPLTGGEPAGAGHAVWTVGQAESHNAILFDDATPGWNFGIRPQAGETLTVRFVKPLFIGRQRVMAHVGHLHGAVGLNDVDVQMQCRIQHETFPAMFHEYDVQLAEINDASEPMALLTEVVDRDDVFFPWGNCRLEVEFTIDATAVDPEHPLGLFGIRLTDE